jgi:hypothetical protein
MAIPRTNMIDDDGSGTTGTIINNAWKQELYNQIDTLGGPWVNLPFNAANYTALAGAWTVAAGYQVMLRYSVNSAVRAVTILFNLGGNASLSASTTYLFVALPGLPAPADNTHGGTPTVMLAAAGATTGLVIPQVVTGAARLAFSVNMSGTPFVIQTNSALYLQGSVLYSY